jgi:hypothetical protein
LSLAAAAGGEGGAVPGKELDPPSCSVRARPGFGSRLLVQDRRRDRGRICRFMSRTTRVILRRVYRPAGGGPDTDGPNQAGASEADRELDILPIKMLVPM